MQAVTRGFILSGIIGEKVECDGNPKEAQILPLKAEI